MGILSRFALLMKSNINHIIDRAHNPEKVIKETLREISLDLRTLQSETNAVKADEQRAKRSLDECEVDILKFERFSKKAEQDSDALKAKKFLDQKEEVESKKQDLIATYNKLVIEVKQMKLLEEKLAMDLAQLEKRSESLKEKVSIVEKQMTEALFGDYEEKLNYKLDEANALAALRSNSLHTTTSIDEEIAALEAKQSLE